MLNHKIALREYERRGIVFGDEVWCEVCMTHKKNYGVDVSDDLAGTLLEVAPRYLRGDALEVTKDQIRRGDVVSARDTILEILECRYHNGIVGEQDTRVVCVRLGVDPGVLQPPKRIR